MAEWGPELHLPDVKQGCIVSGFVPLPKLLRLVMATSISLGESVKQAFTASPEMPFF